MCMHQIQYSAVPDPAMPYTFSHPRHKARLASLLIAAFLFQAAIPVLAQVGSTLAGNNQAEENQITLCTMQGPKLVTLSNGPEQQEEVASSSQWCPACLLHHLPHTALPPMGGLATLAVSHKTGWQPTANTQLHRHTRLTQTPIRAPPHS